MTQLEIQNFTAALENVQSEENMGYIFFFVGIERLIPFVSIAQSDNEYDRASQLDRESVFRVNIGVSKESFESLFADSNPEAPVDYAALDIFMPHPDYAKQFFICILNPSEKNEERTKKFIEEAHALATRKMELKKGA